MFKVVKIGDKKIPMKSSGLTGRLYSRYFGRDILSDFMKISSKNYDKVSQVFEELAWTLAKTANNNIPDVEEWLGQFDGAFDVISSYDQIMELMGDSFKSNVNRKKKTNKNPKK